MMIEKGNLGDNSPIRLFLSIHEQNVSGSMQLTQDATSKLFYLNQGKLCWAVSNSEEDKLERILIDKNLVNTTSIEQVKQNQSALDSFEKALVENGLLTLDELVNTTRDQMKQIVFSTLRWKSGEFQFATDQAPPRLVSLELEVLPLISTFIKENIDTDSIWEELRSAQIEMVHTPDIEKIKKYPLTAEQNEIYAAFKEGNQLESVLTKFAERSSAVLKLIYFFLTAGLLVKKEPEAMGMVEPPLETASPEPMAISIPEAAPQEEIPLPEPELLMTETGSTLSTGDIPYSFRDELDQLQEPSERADKGTATKDRHSPYVSKSTPRKKTIASPLLLVLLMVVLGAVIYWQFFAAKGGNESSQPRIPQPITRIRKTPPTQVQSIPTAVDSSSSVPDAKPVMAPETTSKQAEPGESTKKEPVPAPDTKPLPPPSNQPATLATPKTAGSAGGTLISGLRERAWQDFDRGDMRQAAELWRQELLQSDYRFSILLELDCQKESVRHAWGRILDKKEFFLLNRIRNDRICFLVFWGRFRTATEANRQLPLIPAYFHKQVNPPEVLELFPYLN